jgi:anti-anti-sigma regulatory factor
VVIRKIIVTQPSKASKFAHGVGVTDVINDVIPESIGEPGRTVKLRRISDFTKIELLSSEISHLLFPNNDDIDTRKTVQYVIVELLRNIIQHSNDPLGGIAAAQLMTVGLLYNDVPCVQVAVCDCGIGIREALKLKHPDITNTKVALEKALWPHISGMFEEGLTGSGQNAGMGLFFISEMTKLTGGKLFISSIEDTLFLEADPKDPDNHTLKYLNDNCSAFPGTLVVFELPIGSVADYDSLIETIRKRARDRTPQRAKHSWIRYNRRPQDARQFLIKISSENTVAAEIFAQENLVPLIMKKQKIILDFREVEIATQSYLHALLFESLRLAWAMRTYIYVVNISPSVKSGLDLLQNYALGG